MNLQKNESLNSYFIRSLLINQGIITPSSYNTVMHRNDFSWNRGFTFKLDKQLIDTPKKIEGIITNNSILGLYRPILPFELYVTILSKLGNSTPQKSSIPKEFHGYGTSSENAFYYCRVCLRERLENRGFIWFDTQWQFHDTNYCEKHDIKLNTSYCNNCQYGGSFYKPSKKITKAFSGVCSSCGCSFLVDGNFTELDWPPSPRRTYSKISDKNIFLEKYPNFTRGLILKILEEAKYKAIKKEGLSKHHSPFSRILHHQNDIINLKKYLSGKSLFIQHRVFWRIIKYSFGNTRSFNKYLYNESKVNLISSKEIFPDLINSFVIKQLEIN